MKNIFVKKILSVSIIALISVQIFYLTLLEPTVVIAASATDNVVVTLNVDAGISISNGADAAMAPNIGISSNKSIGSSSWIVKTNSAGGYILAVRASTTPALKNGAVDNFADYTPATPSVPDVWANVASGTKEFGFSAYGTNVLSAFGTGSSCGSAGVPTATLKFQGFTTSDYTIANSSTFTNTTGVTTNICFAAEQNNVYAASGVYTATITATATTQ